MSDVPRSVQSWVSTIPTVVLTADVFQLFCKTSMMPDTIRVHALVWEKQGLKKKSVRVRRIMHSIWHCCVENVHTIRLLCMMRWNGHNSGNVCDVVMLCTYLIPYLSTGTFCRNMTVSATSCVVSTKYSIFFHLVSCCVLVIASLRAFVLACLADLPPASACGQAHATYHRLRCEHCDVWVGRSP